MKIFCKIFVTHTKTKKYLTSTFILLGLILFVGFFLRIYNIGNTLGFYYDQGRDALVIWDLWHKADFFLLGPTTGIAGIFRAPYYYYFIAPFYLIGGGNPVWPSIFLSTTTMAASFLAFFLGRKIHSDTAGIIAAIISSVSFNIVMASRWLSNPTPMLLLSMLLVLFMLLVAEGKKNAWCGISLVLGLSLFSFGSASEVFYFVAVAIFAIWQRKNLPNKKQLLVSVGLFLFTVAPLIVFDLKNNFLISSNLKKFFIEDKSFGLVTWNMIAEKIIFYKNVFGRLIFHGRWPKEMFFFGVVLTLIVFYSKKLIKLKGVKILLLLFTSMLVGLVFFQGNQGNFYDYYLTGYYLIFILLFSIGLGEIWKKRLLGKVLILFFMYLFLVNNFDFLQYKITDKVDSPGSIALKTELQAVEWVKKDSKNKEFNIDVYVPPVISYSYDYLFLWKGVTQEENEVPLLYTLYEGEPKESERLTEWLDRQKTIGEVVDSTRFGGVTVQKRERLLNK